MAKEVYLPIGLPGSGKTTYLNTLLNGKKATTVSMDEIRQELTGDMSNMTKETEVKKLALDRFDKALKSKQKKDQIVIWDATSLSPKGRKLLIDRICQWAKDAVLKVLEFKLNAQQAIERQKNRQRQVPPAAIHHLAKFYVPFTPVEAQGLAWEHTQIFPDGQTATQTSTQQKTA